MVRDIQRWEKYLFNERPWSELEQVAEAGVRNEIDSIVADRFLNTSAEDLVTYFVDKYSFELPKLGENVEVDSNEAKIDVSRDPDRYFSAPGKAQNVPGFRLTVSVPFEGDSGLFNVKPMTWSTNPPRASIREDYLLFEIETTNLNRDIIKSTIEQFTNSLRQYLGWLHPSIAGWNSRLPNLARTTISGRRDRLLQSRSIVASLGCKVKQRDTQTLTFSPPEVRRKVIPRMPIATSATFNPEPALLQDDYEHILKVMQNVALVMERSPSAFTTMGEESIRTQFLVQLNGHYEGQATAETFNGIGKTDILIRVSGRNIFIAECKFWGGAKVLTATINQLLGYATWRDSKVAVVLFNRNRDFGKVLEDIGPTVEMHPNFKRKLPKPHETSFRFIMAQKDDPNREMTMTVLAFDVPRPDKHIED